MVGKSAAIIFHDFGDGEHFWGCNLLDTLHVVFCEPFVLLWGNSLKVDYLDQDRHFTVPGLVDEALPFFLLDDNWNSFSFGDEVLCILDKSLFERCSI